MANRNIWDNEGPQSNADAVASARGRTRAIHRRTCKDHALRKRLEDDPPRWLKTFFPLRFSLPWAPYHFDIINDSLYAIRNASNQLIIAPRGGGKSRPVMGVVFYAVLTGQSSFPVYAPWKSEAVDAAFRFWIGALANNKLLADLYPEVCDPFRAAKGAPQRIGSLTWDDTSDPTGARLNVSDGLVILPDSRGIIGSTTINGNPLGMAFDAPDGSTIRPTTIFIDDPQDDKTSISGTLVEKTVRKIDADFGGMGGPDRKLAMIMCATVKNIGDVTSHYRAAPEWNVKATPRIVAWPHEWEKEDSVTRKLWAEWADIRQEGLHEKDSAVAARKFYKEHKKEMIKGMVVSWPSRFDKKKGEPDAFYSAMWDYYRMGERAFMAEMQNEPIEEGAENIPYKITPELIASRISDRGPFIVPEWEQIRLASTDLNWSYAFTSSILSVGVDQRTSVLWYGLFKDAPLPIKDDTPPNVAKQKLWEALRTHGLQLASSQCRPEMWFIDCSGDFFWTVIEFCMSAPKLCGLTAVPMRGQNFKQYKTYAKNVSNIKEMCHLRREPHENMPCKWVVWHTDYWREVAQRAWLGSVGAPGSVSLFKGSHNEFGTQICREQLKGKGEVGGDMIWNWRTAPGAHDYGDVMAQAYAGAAWAGIGTGGQVIRTRPKETRKCKVQIQ